MPRLSGWYPQRMAAAGVAFVAVALGLFAMRDADLGIASNSAPAPGEPKIAVMVHGYQGLFPWSRGYRCSDGILAYDQSGLPEGRSPRAAGEFGRLAARLAHAGYDVYFARWTTGGSTTIALKDAAACLAGQIAEARQRTAKRTGKPAPPVTLVAHSMGGLVSRTYVEGGAAPSRADVAALATFGTPHLGVATDVLLQMLALLNPAAIIRGGLGCDVNPGTCELSYDAVTAFNRTHKPRAGVAYNAVAGDKSVVPLSWFVAGSDDGVVETRSAAGIDVPRWQVNDAHAAVMPLVTDYYAVSDDSVRCLEGFLTLDTAGRGVCRRITRAVGMLVEPGADDAGVEVGEDVLTGVDDDSGDAASAPESAGSPASPTTGLPMSPVTALHLAPGEARTVSIVIDGSTADIAIGWAAGTGTTGGAETIDRSNASYAPDAPDVLYTSDPSQSSTAPEAADASARPDRAGRSRASLDARLLMPSGLLLNPADVDTALPGSQHVALDRGATAGIVVFRMVRPPSGTWTVVARNTGGVAVDVGVFATMASPIRLEARAGLGGPTGQSDRIPLTAGLTDNNFGLAGARVEATVYGPGDAVSTTVLEDRGDGVYVGAVERGGPDGLRHLAVRAFGMTAEGAVFERESGIIVALE